MKNTAAKPKLQAAFNLLLALMVLWAWLSMVFDPSSGALLSSRGIASLKYFTVLSNLLEAAASLLFAVSLLRNAASRWTLLLKYVAAAAVGLTFIVVMVFLGPLYGYPAMFVGGNLWLHLLVPVLAMTEFCLSFRDLKPTGRESLLCVLSPLIYGLFYLGNILINGRGEWPNTNDWYGFVMWGLPVGLLIFLVILLATWVIALLLRTGNRRFGEILRK